MSSTLLGHYNFKYNNFELLDNQFLKSPRLDAILKNMLQRIIEAPEPAFLLPNLLRALQTINSHQWLAEPLNMMTFEFWLNHFSGLSLEGEMEVRGKITGKKIPREAFQRFFPIGRNKMYPGTHFVSAHLSPDLDTTVASFINWLDAFSAKVGLGQHIWSLPGGPSDPSYPDLFKKLWGEDPFHLIASHAPTLSLQAIDLLTRQGMKEVEGSISMTEVDKGLHENAILLVDKNKYFIGDWHAKDAEMVRPVIISFKTLLRQFENEFLIRILRFFGESNSISDVYFETFETKLPFPNALQDLNEAEKDLLNILLQKVLKVPQGLDGTFEDLGNAFEKIGKNGFNQFRLQVKEIGKIKNKNRQVIFQTIENLIAHLSQAISECRQWVEELYTVVNLKLQLKRSQAVALSLKSSLEEIRTKMESQDYLTVLADDSQSSYPLGIIFKNALTRLPLGTVSLRDFSNFEEVHMASYLSVISIIDHHKTSVQTSNPSLIIVGDVESCNTLIAEQLFIINNIELKEKEYIHPDRVIAEYFSCLYAILDDTDFLSKVSSRDIECVATLLNQLKTLITGNKEACITLNDLPRDHRFINEGAKRILQNPEMFSIYEKIIEKREILTNEALKELNKEVLLGDTKEQNGCTRVGQTKLFPSNFFLFEKQKEAFRSLFGEQAKKITAAHPEITLHLHMISTIPSSQELYSKNKENTHKDELWIMIADNSLYAESLLASFLNSFLNSPEINQKALELELLNDKKGKMEKIFQHNFLPLPVTKTPYNQDFAVIYLKAGSLNSRKSMVSPFLPRKVP